MMSPPSSRRGARPISAMGSIRRPSLPPEESLPSCAILQVSSKADNGEGDSHEDEGQACGKDARHCLDIDEEEGGIQPGLHKELDDYHSAREPA